MLESLLDEIPGLGETRRTALLERFGSVAALRKAGSAEIAELPGIGEKTAAAIEAALNSAESGLAVDAQTGEITESK